MSSKCIRDTVNKVKSKYQESDPFRLAAAMHILVQKMPMGNSPTCCKGFCMTESRKTCIVINCDLPEIIQQIILIHEIGHAVLHQKSMQVKCFHDFELFDGVSQCEYEANCFAADYLLEDEDVLEKLNADMSFFQAASELQVPPELLDFKFRMMKRNGVQIVDSPITANSNFLKDIPTEGIIENY